MRSWMEILHPSMMPYFPDSGLFNDQSIRRSPGGHWTHEENKRFEDALAEIDEGTPDRWEKVASMIPGKTAEDVKRRYRELEVDVSHIEAGLIPPPEYGCPQFTLDWLDSRGLEGLKQSHVVADGRRSRGRPCDREKKKGIPWTEDEHKLFLLGLQKHGKGDWRNISQKCVISRTPTQVASHAQKYFIRLSSGGKDKRRSSIHDITTANMSETGLPSPPQPSAISMYSSSAVGSSSPEQFSTVIVNSNRSSEESGIYNRASTVSQIHGNLLIQPPCDISPYGLKFEA